jgi:hypothetical protein
MRPCSRLCNLGSYGIYRDQQSMYTRHDEAGDRYCAISLINHNRQALIRTISPENALHAGHIIGEVVGFSALR